MRYVHGLRLFVDYLWTENYFEIVIYLYIPALKYVRIHTYIYSFIV